MTLERNVTPPSPGHIIMSAIPASTMTGGEKTTLHHTIATLDGVRKDEPMYSRNSPNMLNILAASSDLEFSN
ncbi:unnamed protein product, partial [Candidula unifasciata]